MLSKNPKVRGVLSGNLIIKNVLSDNSLLRKLLKRNAKISPKNVIVVHLNVKSLRNKFALL